MVSLRKLKLTQAGCQIWTPGSSAKFSHSAGYYLPPQYRPSPAAAPSPPPVTAKLENKELWEKFHSVGTEMILTKNGRRMFPEFSVSLSGLDQHCLYSLCVQAVPEGESRYKWRDGVWSMSGRAEPGPPTSLYLHPESPAPGQRWMERAIGFSKIRLTNNTLSQGGQIVLQSMHRYFLRLHVIPTSHSGSPPRPVSSVSFPETSFIAVTSYQNSRLSLLKIEENPFAKGIKYFKNQKDNHTPRKRISRPEASGDSDPVCKRIKESAGDVTSSPGDSAGVEQHVLRESAQEREERAELSGESAEARQPATAESCSEGRQLGHATCVERGREVALHESMEKRTERAQRVDMFVHWGRTAQRPMWVPSSAVSPIPVTGYPPPACLMGHRLPHPSPPSLAPFSSPMAMPHVPLDAPYFLGSWASPPIRLSNSFPGLHPQLFQQMCGPSWYLSPHTTSRGL
ncbi:T-box protein VegT-like [Pseudophryne corroboree]|uniref:T-box protein VegT-like n=1 Tax=Pseudophryne corroboree TaxID=495146 RepID=UPI00308190A7